MPNDKRSPPREPTPSGTEEIGSTSGKTHDEVLSETLDPETARKARAARATGTKDVGP